MEKDLITQQEAKNDGKTIYLYYNDEIGLYVAFGLSAYYTTMVTEPILSYSDELNTPVAMLRRKHILSLRQSLTKVEHQPKQYYQFRLRNHVGDAGYLKWKVSLMEQHEKPIVR